MSGYPKDKGFKRNERITLEALAIFDEIVRSEINKRKMLVDKYNALVKKLTFVKT